MDRKKYGEIIVDQIINDYRNSKEYRQDAANYIYKWLTCILNYKTADLGNNFVNGLNGTMTVPEENQQKFMEGMEMYNDLREKMNTLFKMLSDEGADDWAPIQDSTLCDPSTMFKDNKKVYNISK
jgi:hypothetical protein